MKKELTVVVPAYNEVTKLNVTASEILQSASNLLDRYEVIIVNDGSADGTAGVADALAEINRTHVKVIHLTENKGVGNAFAMGLRQASYQYITLIPGDHAFAKSGIDRLFGRVGAADLLVTYRANPNARSFLRCWLSRLATLLMKLLSGRAIRDAHSLFVYPVSVVRMISFSTGYGYHMETLARLLLTVERFEELPVELNPKPDESSGVMKIRTLVILGVTVLRLFYLRLTGRLARKYQDVSS